MGKFLYHPLFLRSLVSPTPPPLKFSLTLHQRSRYLANFNIKNCFYCFSVLMVSAHYPLWLKDNVYLLLLKNFLVLPPWFPCQLPFWNFMLNKTWYSTKAYRQTRLRAYQLNSTVSREDPNRPSLTKVPLFHCLKFNSLRFHFTCIPMFRNCGKGTLSFVSAKERSFSLCWAIVKPAATRRKSLSFQIRFVFSMHVLFK